MSLLAYTPFVSPLPIAAYWALLLLPLTAGISVVYKCTKCEDVREIPRDAVVLFFWILGSMAAAAVGLYVIVELTTKR